MTGVKLCFILPVFDPNTPTHYAHIYKLIEEIAKTHNVFLFAETATKRANIKNLAGFYQQKCSFLPLRLAERIVLFSLLRMKGYSIFYHHYAVTSAILAKVTTGLFGGKTYLWMCVQSHLYEKPLTLKTAKEKLTKDWPTRIALKMVDGLVTCSSSMKHYYKKFFGIRAEKIVVIPNWINLQRFDSTKYSRKKEKQRLHLTGKTVILFVHRLSERKGADRLPKIIEQVKGHVKNAHLLIVGEGPLLDSLERRVKHQTLTERVSIRGAVPNREIPRYFAAADLLLLPSRTEEFGRVYLEAMAMDTPIIATDTLGARTVLTKTQKRWVVRQTNEEQIIDSLSTKIEQLLSDKKARSLLVRIGRKRVKAFSLDRIAPKFINQVIAA